MTKFLKIKKLVSRHTKGFQAINEHMLLQNCGEKSPEGALGILLFSVWKNLLSLPIIYFDIPYPDFCR